MKIHAPTDIAAPPESAWPDVHPRAARAASPISTPPENANVRRTGIETAAEVGGPTRVAPLTSAAPPPLITFHPNRPAVYAPIAPPTNTPRISNTSQSSRTLDLSPFVDARFGFAATCDGATTSATATPRRLAAPDAPSPLLMTRNVVRRTRPSALPPR